MGNILCRFCTNNIVDTDPHQDESHRRLSGIKKVAPTSVITQYKKSAPLILPDREKVASDALYQNLFSKTPNQVTTILVQPEVMVETTDPIDEVRNEMASPRPIPVGCEASQPVDANGEDASDLEVLEIDDNHGSTSDLDADANKSRLNMTSSELRLGAGALVENVLAAAMVSTAEAHQFDSTDNDLNGSGKVNATVPIPSGISLGYSFSTTSDSSLTKFYKTAIEQVKDKEHQNTRLFTSDNMESSSGKVQSKVEPPLHPTASEKEPWSCGEVTVGATLIQSDIDTGVFKSQAQANERPPINQESTGKRKIIDLDKEEIINSQEPVEKYINTGNMWEYVDDFHELSQECFNNMHTVSFDANKYFDENDLESVSCSALDLHAKCIVTKTLERIVKSYVAVDTASNVND